MLETLLSFFAAHFLYLALHLESGSFPKPMNAEQEREAFKALRAGDPAARETIIRHNLRLVAHIAKKYYALPGDQEDLISIGTIGLIKAVNTFDDTRRARFSTYASKCIENAILSPKRFTTHKQKQAGSTLPMLPACFLRFGLLDHRIQQLCFLRKWTVQSLNGAHDRIRVDLCCALGQFLRVLRRSRRINDPMDRVV